MVKTKSDLLMFNDRLWISLKIFFLSVALGFFHISFLKSFQYFRLFDNVVELFPFFVLPSALGIICQKVPVLQKISNRVRIYLFFTSTFLIGISFAIANELLFISSSFFCMYFLGFILSLYFEKTTPLKAYFPEALGALAGIGFNVISLSFIGVEMAGLSIVAALSFLFLFPLKEKFMHYIPNILVFIFIGWFMFIQPLDFSNIHFEKSKNSNETGYFHRSLERGGKVIYSKWSFHDRVDVMKVGNEITLLHNRIAASPVTSQVRVFSKESILPDVRSAFIVGVGGGDEIHELKKAGVTQITGAEASHNVIDLMSNQLKRESQFVYLKHTICPKDGRICLRESNKKFDLMSFIFPSFVSNTFGFIPSDNYLYAVEAFNEYWNSLSLNGSIVIAATFNLADYSFPTTILRTINQILLQKGLHFNDYVALFKKNTYGNDYIIIYLKKSPWTQKELNYLVPMYGNKIDFDKNLLTAHHLKNYYYTDNNPVAALPEAKKAIFGSKIINLTLVISSLIIAFILIFQKTTSRSNPRVFILFSFLTGLLFGCFEIYCLRIFNWSNGSPIQNLLVVLTVPIFCTALLTKLLDLGLLERIVKIACFTFPLFVGGLVLSNAFFPKNYLFIQILTAICLILFSLCAGGIFPMICKRGRELSKNYVANLAALAVASPLSLYLSASYGLFNFGLIVFAISLFLVLILWLKRNLIF